MTTWHRVASVSELREGEGLPVDFDGVAIALYRINGAIHAIDDVCPHEFALLSQGFVQDGVVECPLHAAQFDIATGACLCGPAAEDLRIYPVRQDGDDIYVGAPEP